MNMLHNINKVMKDVLVEFGFCGYKSLFISLLRIENMKLLGGFAAFGVITEKLLGLNSYSLLILCFLILIELIIGIFAGVRRTKRFKLRMLQRFGLKVFIYFLLMLVLNSLVLQYNDRPEFYAYSALHSFVVFYVTGVYLISVLENTAYLLGGSKELTGLLKVFKFRLKKATEIITTEENNLT